MWSTNYLASFFSNYGFFKKYKPVSIPVTVLFLALVFRLATAWINVGFVAIDDYYLLYYSVPAQIPAELETNFGDFISRSDIRSPIPGLFVHSVARLALTVGLTDPLDQIRLIYMALGIVSLLTVYFTYKIFLLVNNPAAAFVAILLAAFHFVMPYISTRTLIENMATPFLTISLYYLIQYHTTLRVRSIAISMIWLGIASVFRFQVGVVAPALFLIVFYHKRYRDLIALTAAGLFIFVATGLVDYMLRGGFHESLYRYVHYNIYHSSDFGVSPFWTYLPSLIFISIPPFLLSRFQGFSWSEYKPLLPAALYFVFFVIVHSLIPHKEERFLSPILPAAFVLITPLLVYFTNNRKMRWRVWGFAAVNAVLLFIVSFSVSQLNVIGVARFFHKEKRVSKIAVFEDSLKQLPISYAMRPDVKDIRVITRNNLQDLTIQDCREVLIIRENYLPLLEGKLTDFRQVSVFQSSPVERALVKMNPMGNLRRASIYLYQPLRCPLVSVNERSVADRFF